MGGTIIWIHRTKFDSLVRYKSGQTLHSLDTIGAKIGDEILGRMERPGQKSRSNERRHTVTEQEIESKVIEIVAEQMGADKEKISRTTSFMEDLNADSLDTVELVMEFEDEFETSIPDDQAEKILTVGNAIDFIMQANGTE